MADSDVEIVTEVFLLFLDQIFDLFTHLTVADSFLYIVLTFEILFRTEQSQYVLLQR